MILFGAPGACSQASHIALIEAGLPHRFTKVGRDKRTEDGRDFLTINPTGVHPALELDDGTVLTESFVILLFIADRSGKLLAAQGADRWRTLQTLEFMTTEIHCPFRPLFYSDATSRERERAVDQLTKRFAVLDDQLGDKRFLVGDDMTIADAYLFVMLSWAVAKGVVVPTRLAGFSARMNEVASVAKALADEGFA